MPTSSTYKCVRCRRLTPEAIFRVTGYLGQHFKNDESAFCWDCVRVDSKYVKEMIPRLTFATFYALAASGLILAAPGEVPWLFWLAHGVALGALGVAGWLVIRGWRGMRIGAIFRS